MVLLVVPAPVRMEPRPCGTCHHGAHQGACSAPVALEPSGGCGCNDYRPACGLVGANGPCHRPGECAPDGQHQTFVPGGSICWSEESSAQFRAVPAGQPKDPLEAVTAGKPLMFIGEDEMGACWVSLGTPEAESIVLEVFGQGDATARSLAEDIKTRWNEHHDLKARVEEMERALAVLVFRADDQRPIAERAVAAVRASKVLLGEE